MLLFFLLTAVSATVPPYYLDNSSALHPSPFYPDDDTRIRWSQCEEGEHGKSLCFQSAHCDDPTDIPHGSWNSYKKGDLKEIRKDESYTCSSGQMIRPINTSYWLVYFQFAPGIDPKAGIKLYIQNDDRDRDFTYVFGKCAFDEETQKVVFESSTDKIGFSDTANQKTIDAGLPSADIKIKSELLHGFVDEFGMSCVFSIEATKETDRDLRPSTIEVQLKKVYEADLPNNPNKMDNSNKPKRRKNEFKSSKLITEIKRFLPSEKRDKNPSNYDNGFVEPIGSPESIGKTVNDLLKRAKRKFNYKKPIGDEITKDVELRRDFILDEVNIDFNTMGCSDKAARLVVHQENGLREVTTHVIQIAQGVENFTHYIVYNDSQKVEWKPKTTSEIHASCMKKSCLVCDPLPPLLDDCDGCSPPLVKLPMNRKDCPILQCDSNQWVFKDSTGNVSTSRGESGIECRKGEDDQPGWFRSNGTAVSEAACAPIKSCTLFSPLNATTCDGVNSTNECLIISDDNVTCPAGANLLYRSGDKFKLMDSSLHCDFFTGTWYYGKDAHKDFNTSIELICDGRRDEELTIEFITWVSFIVVCVCTCVLSSIFVAIGCCWNESRKSHLKHRLRKINPYKRAMTQWPPAYADLTEVTDIMATPKADFFGIIQEWPMYSVVERVKFCTNLLEELGLTVKIDQYLSLFGHCVQMESDYRVWRKLVLGYKMILVGFNSVNRSRVAMKFQADLLLGMNRLLNRIGYEHVEGADETLNFVRDMVFSTFLACNNPIGIAHLYEEGELRDGCEDIRKRRQILAYRQRFDGVNLPNCRDLLEDIANHKEKSYTNIMHGPPMPDDEDFLEARKQMRRTKGIFVDETQPEKYWKIIAEREAKVKCAELEQIHGSWREHLVYSLCVGPDPDVVQLVIGEVSKGDFFARELVNCFKAAVEDCFDMRYAAREAFIKNHNHVREKCPIGSAEYMEIFEMFMRFAHLEYNETDETWLMKHVGNPGYFEQSDKEFLPITRLSEQAEYGRKFMAMLQAYKIKPVLRRGEYQKDDETPRAHSPVRPMAPLADPKAGTESALRSDDLEPYQSSGPGSSDNGPGPFGTTTKSNQRSDTKSKAASASASRSKQGTASNSSAPKPETASNSKQEPGPGSKAPGPAK